MISSGDISLNLKTWYVSWSKSNWASLMGGRPFRLALADELIWFMILSVSHWVSLSKLLPLRQPVLDGQPLQTNGALKRRLQVSGTKSLHEKCYGYTQGMKENDGYSRSSSAKGTDAGRQKKARQKELLEEYLEKRAQMKEFQQEALEEKIAKQELERSRLTKVWSSKRQMAAATNAYESNVMTETSTGSNSLLG